MTSQSLENIRVGAKWAFLVCLMINTVLLMLCITAIVALVGIYASPVRLFGLTGTSMEPYSYEGDLMVARCDIEPEVGDVIVFPNEDGTGYVSHRIIAETYAEETGFVTKGDNNDVTDHGLVSHNEVVAVSQAIIPHAGWLTNISFTKTLGTACVLFLTLMVFLFAYLMCAGKLVWVDNQGHPVWLTSYNDKGNHNMNETKIGELRG